MANPARNSYSYVLFCLLAIISGVKGLNRNYDGPHTLFVFGDSYADTGNWKKSFTSSWKLPYGITFPGKPTGRFSDGRVLTDYIASYLDIRSPIPYKFMKIASKSYFRYGMNFAYGGTGVFDTLVKEPNMTVQIDIFQRLVEKKVFKEEYLNSSIALVSVAGNDYFAYVVKNDNDNKNLPAFTTSLIDQLATNLERIHSLGVRKIAVTAIEPMGCLPVATASSSYKNCSKAGNLTSKFHNEILAKTVQKLNEQRKRTDKSAFVMLNLYDAFLSAMKKHRKHTGSLKVKMNPLEPCCVGSCGSVDKSGAKLYNVCKKPAASFFWDSVHLSQNGWHAVYLALRSSLHKLTRM
ncbi:hypothetical protein SLE2022_111310 [Rubroshorea leprosula]